MFLSFLLFQQGGVPNKPKGPLEALRPKLQVATSTHTRCMIVYSLKARGKWSKKNPRLFYCKIVPDPYNCLVAYGLSKLIWEAVLIHYMS